MSLRLQIHDAIDQVSPPPVALERRVVAFVFAPNNQRRSLPTAPRSEYRKDRFRSLYALAAAVLILTLAGGLLFGGRLLRQLSNPPASVNQAMLGQLEARPWRLPEVAPGAACPASTSRYVDDAPGMVAGRGPLYFAGGHGEGTTSWGDWLRFHMYYSFPGEPAGPVLIRARDLKVPGALVVFAANQLTPSDLLPAGRAVGFDTLQDRTLQMRTEAVVESPFKYWGFMQLLAGLQKGGSGCIGFQIDGPSGVDDTLIMDTPPPWVS
jgi:hypothetical protein